MITILTFLTGTAACSALLPSGPKPFSVAGDTWERFIIQHEGVVVELRVPPGGEPPPVPDRATTSVLSAYLLNLRYGYARDYAPNLHLVAFFQKRPGPGSLNPQAEAFREELREIDRRWRMEAGLKEGSASLSTFDWQPLQIGGRTWFTAADAPRAFPYLTPVSPRLILVLRGSSSEKTARALQEHQRIVEDVVASVQVVSQ